jgi:hypothetical protein
MGASLLDSVLRSRLCRRLLLHVGRVVGAAPLERNNVIDDVPRADAGTGPGRGTRVDCLERATSGRAPPDTAVCVPFATLAELRTIVGSRAVAERGLTGADRVTLCISLIAWFGAVPRPSAGS